MKSTHKSLQRLSLAILCGAALPLAAQTGPAPSEETSLDEDVYILSPFEVRSDESIGYLATQTLAGTRIRTDLKDVGSAISVITTEMLTDIGATDNSTLLQFTANAEVAGTRGTYGGLGNGTTLDETESLRAPAGANRVRGLAKADNTRDFYITDIPWDSYITDRVDIQRGPNSLLFGLGSPAGIVNAALDSAQFYDTGEIQFRVGSYGSIRGSIDINRQIIKDVLAVRVEGLSDREKFQQDPAFEDDDRAYVAVRFEPKWLDPQKFRTTLRANYEHGTINANRPRIVPPNDAISPWFAPAANDRNFTTTTGMGKTPVTNPYDARNELVDTFPTADQTPYYRSWGMNIDKSNNMNWQPYLGTIVNQQQPIYFMDGGSGEILGATSGYINVGARMPNNSIRGPSDGLFGKAYSEQFFRVLNYNEYATAAKLPLSGSGQYRTKTLLDDSVFDFYNQLLDGPNKS
ncbi:MAG: TonB-dependent receptor, partial [Opitutales bacterium]|nr:TonB-dependent receptor [Opitutales bacterium]